MFYIVERYCLRKYRWKRKKDKERTKGKYREERSSGSGCETWLLSFRCHDLSGVGKPTEHKVRCVNKCSGSSGNAKVSRFGEKFCTVCCNTVDHEQPSDGRS